MKITNTAEFDAIKDNGVVLVDFYADWCGPCKMISPILEELAKEYEGKVTIAKVNVDENGDIAGRYGVMSIPNLVLFKNGDVVKQVVGFQPKNQLQALLNSAI
ncbi:thioredoxin [Dielma fastidiosa]|uniref:Thioredoxin n=1 Tax=Dielma fastidiosa TaxID=1034346 RepID=A0AB35UIN5_9FIRM|nr:thioredoxin [Dielma fastidiosa]MDY5167842.1 thioredoxin [Dielma fastidiosa]